MSPLGTDGWVAFEEVPSCGWAGFHPDGARSARHQPAVSGFSFGDHFGGALGVTEGQQVRLLGDAPCDGVVNKGEECR